MSRRKEFAGILPLVYQQELTFWGKEEGPVKHPSLWNTEWHYLMIIYSLSVKPNRLWFLIGRSMSLNVFALTSTLEMNAIFRIDSAIKEHPAWTAIALIKLVNMTANVPSITTGGSVRWTSTNVLQIHVRTMEYASAGLTPTLASVRQDTVASIANSTSMIARPHHVRMVAPVWTV